VYYIFTSHNTKQKCVFFYFSSSILVPRRHFFYVLIKNTYKFLVSRRTLKRVEVKFLNLKKI
jgi:hypothetical protein